MKAHRDTLAAIDFTTTEVWTFGGLVTYYILVVMDLKTRRIQIAGLTDHPDAAWVGQTARNLTDPIDVFLRNHTYLLIDRDTKFLPLRGFLTKNTSVEPNILTGSPIDRQTGNSLHTKHGSWLNMAEIELGILGRQCLDRRIPDRNKLTDEVATWQRNRNQSQSKFDWRFTTADARIKLKRLYPITQANESLK